MTNRVFNALLTIMVFSFITFTASLSLSWCNRGGNGIHAHESGKAAYIQGSHCIINMDSTTIMVGDRISYQALEELNDQYVWCVELHKTYLAR